MGDPSFRAVTTTPSIGPSSSEVTRPVSATPACACSGDDQSDPAYIASAATPATATSNRLFRIDTSPPQSRSERQPEAHLRRPILSVHMLQVLRQGALLCADVPVRPVEDVENLGDAID